MKRVHFARTAYLHALICIVMATSSGSAAQDVRVTSAGGNAVSFEVIVPSPVLIPVDGGMVRVRLAGYGSFSPAGAPEFPGRTFRVAVPASGEPRVSFDILEEEALGTLELRPVPGQRLVEGKDGMPVTEFYEAPDPWAGAGPPPAVYAMKPKFMGRQRVLPVRVNPLRPGPDGFRLIRKLSITVSFAGGAGSPFGEPEFRPPVSPAWQRLYDRLLVNPADVTRFGKPLKGRTALTEPAQGTKRLKIQVPETGLYYLRADSLIQTGLTPGLSTGLIALKKYYYDEGEADLVRELSIPIVIKEGTSADGIFNGDDALIFYTLGIKDDVEAGDTDALFTDYHVLWLEEGEPGTLMREAPPMPGSASVQVNGFRAQEKVRKDTYYNKFSFPGSKDYYFAVAPVAGDAVVPFELNSPDATGDFSIRIRLQGAEEDQSSQYLTFSIGGNVLGSGNVTRNDSVSYTFSGNPAGWLTDGVNELAISGGIDYGFLVNDLELSYDALFAARDDALEFAIGSFLGTGRIEIPNFTVNHGILVEITDPADPAYNILTPGDFTGSGNYTLTLRLQADTERRFIVLGDEGGEHIAGTMIAVDTASDLRNEVGPFTSLIISHGAFIDDLAGYSSYRSGQGYRILTVDVEDVYDEFNGGLPAAAAIRRFIKYGFEHWGVEFILLVGDGNEDHKRLAKRPPVDFIPPFTLCVNVLGVYRDEVVATDKWYTFLDEEPPFAAAPGGVEESGAAHPALLQGSGYPDVFIGRFSVGEERELRALLTKLYRFEEVQADEAWRRRVILFSDDSWSFSAIGGIYRYQPSEQRFESSMDKVGRSIENSLPGGFDVQRLFLSHWTDGAHPDPSEQGHLVYQRARDSTQTYFVPYLIDRLNEGALFYSFQGHANRTLLTSEAGFATRKEYDHLRLLRAGSPVHIFIGIGCHISEFALTSELSQEAFAGPGGDCLSEQLLFKSGAGAVSSYASSAFEYLGDNAHYCETLHRVLFQKPPTGPMHPAREQTGAHWVLGEAIAEAEIIQIDSTSYGYDQMFRYMLLGDPHLSVDPGPPLMALEADWGEGWIAVDRDSLRARNGTNTGIFRFTVSDVVALDSTITFEVGGEDRSGDLAITAARDPGLDFARSYTAEFRHTLSLNDGSFLFKVYRPDSAATQHPSGFVEFPLGTSVRLFYNEYLEILPGGESPPTGDFRLIVDFPVYLAEAPELLLDGLRMGGVRLEVTDPADSLHWEARFSQTFAAGTRMLTVRAGGFEYDFVFVVAGDDLVLDTFNFPNPFSEGTNIVYVVNLPIERGEIEIYNVSGTLIRTFDIPPSMLDASNYQQPHSLYWDGRDLAGDPVANGTYFYLIKVERGGSSFDVMGKSVKLR